MITQPKTSLDRKLDAVARRIAEEKARNAPRFTSEQFEQGNHYVGANVSTPPPESTTNSTETTALPLIGQAWPGHGGLFAGLQLSDDGTHLVALILSPEVTDEKFSWEDAKTWAAGISADGHSDYSLPSRFESALLYANVREHIDTKGWYWTGTQSSSNHAFGQHFYYGYQYYGGKSCEGRVRAVRRFPVNPSILLAARKA